MPREELVPWPRLRRALVGATVIATLAAGVAACGDDEGDTGTGPDESASAELCQSLADFSSALDEGAALTTSSSSTEVQGANAAIGGAADDLGLAAQGAGVDIDALSSATMAAAPAITALESDQSAATLASFQDALAPIRDQVQSLEQQEGCS